MKTELNARQSAFVTEYMIDFNATRAAIAAGYTASSAGSTASEMLTFANVAAEVEKRKAQRAAAANLRVEDVVNSINQVLRADPRELVEYRRGACRYCYGIANQYHFTAQEWRAAYVRHLGTKEGKAGKPFDGQGGDGYTPKRDASSDCPECFGDGAPYSFFKDSRTLSADAAALYMGVKETAHGVQILTRSKDAAIDQAARYLGMNKETVNLLTKTAKDMTNDELEALIATEQAKSK
jgi:phage terminase small subunit